MSRRNKAPARGRWSTTLAAGQTHRWTVATFPGRQLVAVDMFKVDLAQPPVDVGVLGSRDGVEVEHSLPQNGYTVIVETDQLVLVARNPTHTVQTIQGEWQAGDAGGG